MNLARVDSESKELRTLYKYEAIDIVRKIGRASALMRTCSSIV